MLLDQFRYFTVVRDLKGMLNRFLNETIFLVSVCSAFV